MGIMWPEGEELKVITPGTEEVVERVNAVISTRLTNEAGRCKQGVTGIFLMCGWI
ncbi:MAG: hypothetical protein K2K64_10280 [Muribaculaceae bacterium]|nr:hypothetical protein [Muribaculaceae bacterium]